MNAPITKEEITVFVMEQATYAGKMYRVNPYHLDKQVRDVIDREIKKYSTRLMNRFVVDVQEVSSMSDIETWLNNTPLFVDLDLTTAEVKSLSLCMAVVEVLLRRGIARVQNVGEEDVKQ